MARRSRNVAARAGFTLVELLVVISIIGMLAALLLPAVNQAREAGRRTVCLNNQGQLAKAIMQYEQKQNKYPGYVNAQGLDRDGTATRPVGWLFSIVSYLERQDLADNFGSNAIQKSIPGTTPLAAVNQYLKVAVCPSDARAETANASGMFESASAASYVVNCGLKDSDFTLGNTQRDWPQNGVFHYNYPYSLTDYRGGSKFKAPAQLQDFDSNNGAFPTDTFVKTPEQVTSISTSFISGGDGTTTTLMLSENVDSNNWSHIWETDVGFVWQAGENGVPGPCKLQSGGVDNLGGETLKRINENVGEVDQATSVLKKETFGRPSSYHPGGVNATFCDTHTSFLADTIDYPVYCQLMSPRGKQAATNPTTGDTSAIKFGIPANAAAYGNYYSNKTLNEKDF